MTNISVIGTGYVGLVTGVCLSDIGHKVTCIDVDKAKIRMMKQGISPIYEPGLEDLMKKNYMAERLVFTDSYEQGLELAEVIYIAVGTPQNKDGSANLTYIKQVAENIACYIKRDTTVIIKSTVPVGTNEIIKGLIEEKLKKNYKINMISNPEFLREGSAIHDAFYGDRIIIGAESEEAAKIVEDINKPFGLPIFKTNIRSAEMIKYASNAFLATKISFVNEIANICEKVEADIEEVAYGMGLDKRIGTQFLKAGIGYGGSCFPKDTEALIQIAGNVKHDFELLKSVINVNNNQQMVLFNKARKKIGDLEGKKVAILGLAFKPNTDDMREAASIVIAQELVEHGAEVIAYDPIAIENAQKVLPKEVRYVHSVEDAIREADMAFIITEWSEIKDFSLEKYQELMNEPIIFDGRNCYDINEIKKQEIDYYSIGRPKIERVKVPVTI